MAFEQLKEIARRIRYVFSKDFANSIKEVLQVENVATDDVLDAIDLWLEMYGDNAPWLKDNHQTLGVPAIIASEIARCVTLEMDVNVSGSKMADYITEQLKSVLKNIRTNVEYACAGGGIVFKPCVSGEKITVEVIRANAFYPTAFDNDHKITGAYFVYRHWIGRKIYTRLEKHDLDGTTYTITNKAYMSYMDKVLGNECSLTEVPNWANIEPVVNITDMESPLFAYFKIPQGNTTDMDSPLGVSVYARAVGNIKEADFQYQRLLWEYEGGEMAIDASEDSFKRVNGVPLLPKGKERLYRTNALDSALGGGDPLKAWNPTLRDANYLNGLNKILMKIEMQCGVSPGTLCDPTAIERTATELRIMKQRSYSTVSDIQEALGDALEELIAAIRSLAVLYELAPDGDYETAFTWDDSIITDADTERERDRQDVRDGFMQKWEYRAKWYCEDEETAKRMVAQEEPDDDEVFGFNNPKKKPEDEDEEE